MALVNPKVPDAYYPPQVKQEGIASTAPDVSLEQRDDVSLPVLVKLVISALRLLANKNGSSVADIQRVLSSEGYVLTVGKLRAAIIQAMKDGSVQRPPSAVEAGVYGLYVPVEGNSPQKPKRRTMANTKRSRSRAGK